MANLFSRRSYRVNCHFIQLCFQKYRLRVDIIPVMLSTSHQPFHTPQQLFLKDGMVNVEWSGRVGACTICSLLFARHSPLCVCVVRHVVLLHICFDPEVHGCFEVPFQNFMRSLSSTLFFCNFPTYWKHFYCLRGILMIEGAVRGGEKGTLIVKIWKGPALLR